MAEAQKKSVDPGETGAKVRMTRKERRARTAAARTSGSACVASAVIAGRSVGMRSASAAGLLRRAGHPDVVNAGGLRHMPA